MDETNEPTRDDPVPTVPAGDAAAPPPDDDVAVPPGAAVPAGYAAFPPPPPPPTAGWGQDPYWNPRPPRRGSLSVAVTALLVAVAVLAGIGIGRSLPTSAPVERASSGRAVNPFEGLGNPSGRSGAPRGPGDVSAIASKVDPSLVDIDTNLTYQGVEAAGTGIVLSSSGLVLTNNHVIDQATSVEVTLVATGKSYTGEVLGYDETSDVALVQVEGASGLKPAVLDTGVPTVGEPVVAVGNAGGKGGKPTAAGGTVIAVDQSITASDEGNDTTEKLSGLIKTDADVQPGDSGGSLVNTKSQVIGVDTAASKSLSFSTEGNEGFAIPISNALGVVHDIEAGKSSATVHVGPTAFIGVTVAPTACLARGKPAITEGTGALVCSVIPGTAAAKAGLAKDDVITSFAGRSIGTPTALTRLLIRYRPGQRAELDYMTAAGQKRTASITLGSGPPG